MPAKTERPTAGAVPDAASPPIEEQLREVLAWLEENGTESNRLGMARYAIPSDRAFGVQVSALQKLAKDLGRSHPLAEALWQTGWYEARMLTAFLDEPKLVTGEQMDRWVGEIDNWAICDTLSFHLFDRTPYAWQKVEEWSERPEEFVKRTAFALLWALTVHDKKAGDAAFLRGLELIEREASDERNFVKKAVNMALRATGKRNRALHTAALEVARRLAASAEAAPRWVGKDALRELKEAKPRG